MRGSWTSPPSPILSFAQRKSPRRASQPGPMPNFPRPPPVSNLMLRSAVSNNVASSPSISGPSQSQTAFVPTLITIAPTPSPSAGGGTNNEGLLDPLLMLRLREQPSVSTIGLNDHEDYSRPFRAWVQNRQDSSTSVGSFNSSASGAADAGHGAERTASPNISILSLKSTSQPRTPDMIQD